MRQINFQSAISIFIGFVLLYALLHFFPYSQIYATMLHNADVLFIEDVARDLNNGGDIFDWRLTQAPYIFPDIFMARVISLFAIELGQVAPVYHVIFGLFLLLGIHFIARLISDLSLNVVLFSFALYSLGFIGLEYGDVISMYFGLIGHHSGVALPLIVACYCVVSILISSDDFYVRHCILFASLFAGVMSDTLVAVAFLPPLFIFICILSFKRLISYGKAIELFGLVLLAVVLGKGFGYMNPFPQDREFMQFVFNNFPSWTIPSIKRFFGDIYIYSTQSIVSAILLFLYAVAFIYSALNVRSFFVKPEALSIGVLFISIFVVLSPTLTILTQLIVGLYGSIDSSRQWAPVLYVSIVFGFIVFINSHSKESDRISIFIGAILLFFIISVIVKMHGFKGKVAPDNGFKKLISCMASENLPLGNIYLADYWFSRPIRMYSNGDYLVAPYNGLQPFTNASNMKSNRLAEPHYVITGHSVKAEDFYAKFGKPKSTHCEMDFFGQKVIILNYANSNFAVDFFRKNSLNSY